MTASLTGRRFGAEGGGLLLAGSHRVESGARRQPRFVRKPGPEDGFGPSAGRYSGRSVSRFLDRLRTGRPIVADGGMGALVSGAVAGLRCPEEANLRAPESVVAVHTSYIAAGAELIETNTFGANHRKLARVLLDDRFEEINSAGVRLAREAREVSGRDVFVAGSIGPLGELEVFDASEHGPLYAAQARVLEGRGVELFMVETFFDLEELVVAVEAVRGVSSLPIVALLTFDDDAEITGGVGAAAAARRLAALDVAAIGTNHGAGPTVALRALRGMRDAGIPLAALPNIGLASLAGGRVVYPHSTPDYFAEFAVQAVGLGARIVGGCCGTTPAQIEAVREAFDAGRVPSGPIEVEEPELALAPPERPAESGLARAFREQRVGRVHRARPAEGRLARGAPRRRPHDPRLRPRRLRRRQRQPDGARPDERPHDLGDAAAGGGHRDDPPRHPARHDRDGPRGRPARRACRGRPKRPGRDGRPAARRRLPRLARRLRGRLDRPRPAHHGAESRRGLPRQGDRRSHVVLRRGRREPVGRRPRPRARPLPPQGRGGSRTSR